MRPARTLSFDFNKSRVVPADGKCVHELFQRQVRCAPEAVAVVFEEQQITYAELNARANQLAHCLQKLGVGPEVLVGICVKRSPMMLIGLLGILKAGGAYVPLDPTYPPERLRFIMDDAATPLVITQRHLLSSLTPGRAHTICLDDWKIIDQESEADPHSETVPQNLSHVIYTSGSTGKPKGVAIQHESVAALIDWASTVFSSEELQGVLASTSICFDLSVFELFVTLSLGGCVILADNTLHLANLKSAQKVTIINTVPTAVAELLRLDAIPETVTTINLAGEALKPTLVQQIYELPHVQRVFDLYGPSEDTTYSTFALRCAGGPATIGRPISNTEARLLDADLQPVPEGMPGEIYLSGLGLARGYLHRPDLTADKFVPNPFSQDMSTRLYRTGDIARRLPDGNLEYLGRMDNQIKLRGFRIELSEIEIRLSQYPSIRDCVVAVRSNDRGEKFLVAYFVADELPRITDLRSFLAHELPEHMIPARFVRLDKIPLNHNGKLDRQALPEPATDRAMLPGECVAPHDEIEIQLTTIWQELLGVGSVGTEDNFFELGGHSLLAARLFMEIESRFGRKLPLATLFEAATVSQLAAILRSQTSPSWSSLVAIQPKGSKPPLFCIHACGAHVFVYLSLVAYLDSDQPVYGLQAQGIDGTQEPYTHIEDMAAHYIKEILELEPHGPYYLLGDTLGGLIAFEIAQQLTRQGRDVGLLAMFDTACPLPLSFGPRVMSHLHHFKELGLKNYLLAAGGSMARKLGLRFPDYSAPVHMTAKEQEFADGISASGDAVQRTEWAIYLATEVNYRPPEQRLPGRITYFLARDNRYGRGENDNRRDWKRGAAEFEVYEIPGRHDTIREDPFVAVLAGKFISCLQRAQQRDRSMMKRKSEP
jgi:amino acid adenylation domain-containing protein